MPFVLAALITGRRICGHAVCEFQGFVVAFVVYSTPATVGLLPFNRYIRIVKSNYYNKIFSPRKSKIWLSCVWLSLTLYLLSRLTIWITFKFHPAFAICTVTFTTTEDRIIHYCFVLGLFFVLSFFVGLFSYYKMFLKICRHEVDVAPSLQNSRNQAGRTSVQVINMSRTLACVAGGFLLCWILMWTFILWRRALFPRHSSRNFTVNRDISYIS